MGSICGRFPREEDQDSSEDDNDSDEEDYQYSTEEEIDGEVNGQAAMACSAGEEVMLQRRNFVPVGQFVGLEPRFASAGSTAGFMRVAALEIEEGDNCDRKIVVLYRCTHFLGASCGGVRAHENTTVVHQLRFIVPPAGDTARSLLCVGASQASLLYPDRFYKRLQRLWSTLTAEVSVPTRASLVEVLVDVGILRTVDKTPKRMEGMRAALEGMARKDFQPELHLEIQLPQPTQCGAGEDCAVCWELLEGDDLAAWPGCSKPHVLHGACLELVLKRGTTCPLCRSLWFIEPKPLDICEENDEIRDNLVDAGHVASASSDAEVNAHVARP
jgi:hypothetical protein